MKTVSLFWFRRDLRLEDNVGLYYALSESTPVLPIFIFDKVILDDLEDKSDARVTFIHSQIENIQSKLKTIDKAMEVHYGNVMDVFSILAEDYTIEHIYCNHDYEPYALRRDADVKKWAESQQIGFSSFKDQVIFEKNEVVKNDGSPYTVFTPFSKKWKALLQDDSFHPWTSESKLDCLTDGVCILPTLSDMEFSRSSVAVDSYSMTEELLFDYKVNRDFPFKTGTSKLSTHLRFGSISIRQACREIENKSESFLNELIWREFYMQILYHFPQVINHNFRRKYDAVNWLNNEEEFQRWCDGKTGYPLVDAGMRQLNETGWMHNRVRMVVASFLCKHLLIDWRLGEAYFAKKLLDFELSSNNGGWQWAAGTGTDAAPYFRIFNPYTQRKRFDPDWQYCKKWIPELNTADYPEPIVKHELARQRCLDAYKTALN